MLVGELGENLLIGVFWVVFFVVLIMLIAGAANAEDIDLRIIAQIESSGNPMAWNRTDDSRGLYQITPICLKEWNNFHSSKRYEMRDLWSPTINREIAEWYLNVRIPSMLRHYGIPDTVDNRIIAWNAGISYLVNGKNIPTITKAYIKKYRGRHEKSR